MAAAGAREGEELLLRSVEAEDEGGGGLCMGERSWRLNFDGFRRLEAQQERLARGIQDFLGVLGQCPADGVAQYYQKQLEIAGKFCRNEHTDKSWFPSFYMLRETVA